MKPPEISKLAGFVPAPVVQNAILAHIRTLEFPFLLSEVVEATRFPKHTVNKVLTRLVKKGILARHKVPMTMRNPLFPDAIMQTYLYRLTDAE